MWLIWISSIDRVQVVNIDQWEQGQVWIIASLVTIKMLSDMWNLTVRRPCVVKLRDVYYSRSWSMIEVCELIWFTRLADNMQAMSTTNRCTFNWWQYSTQAGCSKRFSTILDALSLSHLRPLIGSCSPSRPLIGPLWWRQVGVPGSQSRVIEPRHDKNSSRNQ